MPAVRLGFQIQDADLQMPDDAHAHGSHPITAHIMLSVDPFYLAPRGGN
jgi:hypothetical protein